MLVASMGQTKAGWLDRPSTTLFCNASFILPLTVIPNCNLQLFAIITAPEGGQKGYHFIRTFPTVFQLRDKNR